MHPPYVYQSNYLWFLWISSIFVSTPIVLCHSLECPSLSHSYFLQSIPTSLPYIYMWMRTQNTYMQTHTDKWLRRKTSVHDILAWPKTTKGLWPNLTPRNRKTVLKCNTRRYRHKLKPLLLHLFQEVSLSSSLSEEAHLSELTSQTASSFVPSGAFEIGYFLNARMTRFLGIVIQSSKIQLLGTLFKHPVGVCAGSPLHIQSS